MFNSHNLIEICKQKLFFETVVFVETWRKAMHRKKFSDRKYLSEDDKLVSRQLCLVFHFLYYICLFTLTKNQSVLLVK